MAQADDSIIWAIKNGDLEQVKELIEQNGFNVNQEITTRSPIHYAADYGQSDVLRYLINKGADVNVSPSWFIGKMCLLSLRLRKLIYLLFSLRHTDR